jgi:uncharacterized caspase-like protein
MRNFALVIGVDAYKNSDWNLASATRDAIDFADWTLDIGKVNPADLQLLLTPIGNTLSNPLKLPRSAITVPYAPATSSNIRTAVQHLSKQEGARAYVYFAGHGCSAPGSVRADLPEPILIPSDVGDLTIDYNLALGYSHLQHPLLQAGPSEQFFFIDACRDFRLEDHDRGLANAVGPRRNEGAARLQYLLHAVSPGERATELLKGVFGEVLLQGLSGVDAYVFNPGRNQFEISFKSLSDFVVTEVSQRIDRAFPVEAARYVQKPQALPSRDRIDILLFSYPTASVKPLPLRLLVDPTAARPDTSVDVFYYTPAGESRIADACLSPPLARPAIVHLKPGDYSVRLEPRNHDPWRAPISIPRIKELEITLIAKKLPSSAIQNVASPTTLRFRCADANAPIIVHRPDSQVPVVGLSLVEIPQAVAGIYRAQLILPEGTSPVQLVDFPHDGSIVELQPPPSTLNPEQLATITGVGMRPADTMYVQPSELIGPTADLRVASLLAFSAYATHTFKSQGFMKKLRTFGIKSAPVLAPDSGWITVLVSNGSTRPLDGKKPEEFFAGSVISVVNYMEEIYGRGVAEPLQGFPTAAQFGCECPAGPKFLGLRIPGFADTRYSVSVLANRATVLIVVVNDDATVDVQQYVLPLGTDSGDLEPPDMRAVELGQRFYASSDRVPDHIIDRLLDAKFVDPILGCLAGYLLVRQGAARRYVGEIQENLSPTQIEHSPMRNMLKFFGTIPDSHVLAGLAEPDRRDEHFRNAAKLGVPIFTEGFAALNGAKDIGFKPFFQSIGHSLLSQSPWTAWTAREPVIEFEQNGIRGIPQNWRRLEGFREQIESGASRVAAVLKTSGLKTEIVGTAFLIDERRAISSMRVADEITESGSQQIPTSLQVSLDFGNQPTAPTELLVSEVQPIPEAHISILTLARPALGVARFDLAEKSDVAKVLDDVYLIGYPLSDSRDDSEAVTREFSAKKGAKRLQPGIILEISSDGTSIDHSCFTLTGSGGSPLIHLRTGKVVGVHWGGWKRSYGRGRATVVYTGNKWLAPV